MPAGTILGESEFKRRGFRYPKRCGKSGFNFKILLAAGKILGSPKTESNNMLSTLPPWLRGARDGPGSSEGSSLSDISSFLTDESDRLTLSSLETGQQEGATPGPGHAAENRRLGSTPRRSLTAKLQQFLSPIKRPSLKHGSSGEVSHGRSGSEHREHPSRQSPLEGHLLLPPERPRSTASEVSIPVQNKSSQLFLEILFLDLTHSFLPQSSASLGSEYDLSDTSVCSFNLRKSSDRLSEPPAVEVSFLLNPPCAYPGVLVSFAPFFLTKLLSCPFRCFFPVVRDARLATRWYTTKR